MRVVETFQVRLRTDADRLHTPQAVQHAHRFGHQRVAYAAASGDRCGDHAADAGLGEFEASRDEARVSQQLWPSIRGHSFAEQVHAIGVCAVQVLERAGLLHHEHLAAQLEQRVQRARQQRVKRQAAPRHRHRSRPAQARTSRSTKPMRGKCTCSRPARSSLRSSV
ncbi:hypothetical protein D9M68_861970 [compost metagenome]